MQTRLSTHLQALARDRADVPAVVTAQGQWSYAELLGRVLARAETLQAAGVTEPGRYLAALMHTTVDHALVEAGVDDIRPPAD